MGPRNGDPGATERGCHDRTIDNRDNNSARQKAGVPCSEVSEESALSKQHYYYKYGTRMHARIAAR